MKNFALECSEFENKLKALNSLSLEAVKIKNATQLFNFMKSHTPIDTGELRQSLIIFRDEVGYTKEYAPHTEFGHRTLNGGWVSGQYYLKDGVEHQRPIYRSDLLSELKKAGK